MKIKNILFIYIFNVIQLINKIHLTLKIFNKLPFLLTNYEKTDLLSNRLYEYIAIAR